MALTNRGHEGRTWLLYAVFRKDLQNIFHDFSLRTYWQFLLKWGLTSYFCKSLWPPPLGGPQISNVAILGIVCIFVDPYRRLLACSIFLVKGAITIEFSSGKLILNKKNNKNYEKKKLYEISRLSVTLRLW